MNENKLKNTRRRKYSNKSDSNIDPQADSLLLNDLNVKETSFIQTASKSDGTNFRSSLKKYFKTKFKINKQILDESKDDSFYDYLENRKIIKNSNRPLEKDLYQQNLAAWKPLLTPKFVINLFLICSLIFLPLGIILYFNSNNIYEAKYDYTDCFDYKNRTLTCHDQLVRNISYKCSCRIYFHEENFQNETLFVYYMLENYYQNIRQYVKSVETNKFSEEHSERNLAVGYQSLYKNEKNNKKCEFEPCGAIANSLFNDSYKIFYINQLTNKSVQLNISKADLAWDTDRKYKFSNLLNSQRSNSIKTKFGNNLSKSYYSEDLMVWMRTAAFPSFRKLYGRILLEENQILAHKIDNKNALIYYFLKQFEKNNSLETIENNRTDFELALSNFFKPQETRIMKLPKGNYFIDIDYRYMVKQFDGRKYIILANVSWLGGKCYFMAWAYIIVGSLSFLASFILFFLHVYYGNMHYNTAILLVDAKTSLIR